MENNIVIESRPKLGYSNEYFIIINGLILEVSSIYSMTLTKNTEDKKYKIKIVMKDGGIFHIHIETEESGFAQETFLKIFNTFTQAKKESDNSSLINENADLKRENADLKRENAFLKGMIK